jgi:hypothetical protein
VCAAVPESGFHSSPCVQHDGDVACPAGAYTEKYVEYASFTDNRDCTACTCGAPAGVTCEGVDVFQSADSTCSGLSTTLQGPLPCQQAAFIRADVKFVPAATGGSCQPSPVTATGAATPTGAVTFCCLK